MKNERLKIHGFFLHVCEIIVDSIKKKKFGMILSLSLLLKGFLFKMFEILDSNIIRTQFDLPISIHG